MHHSYHIGEDPEAFISEAGNNINTAQYGFNQFMDRYGLLLLQEHAPIQIIVCHDAGHDYRTALFPEYKQQPSRTEVDPEQKAQKDILMDMLKTFWAATGSTQIKVAGVEADDIIAHICESTDEPIHVYTVDADLLQLQGDHENVQVLLKCEFQDGDEYNGIPHKFISLSKSMLGDTSDNYKGVPGFGPAKWDMLVADYGYDGIQELEECVRTGNYEMLAQALDEGENKALRLLYDNRNEWKKCYNLAILRPELCWKPRGSKLTKMQWVKRVPNWNKLAEVFHRAGCSDLMQEEAISQWEPSQTLITAADVDEELFEQFASECSKSPVVAFDYETSPSENAMLKNPKGGDYLDVKEARITGASFTFGENLQDTIYVPVNHKDSDNVAPPVIGRLIKIAEAESDLVIQNAFFEVAVTKTNLNFWLQACYDTNIMMSYVDEEAESNLKSMSKRELGYNQATYAETVADPETGELRTMRELTAEEVFDYGCDDAIVTAHLWTVLRYRMMTERCLDFYEENETLVQQNLVDAYLTGCEIDWDKLQKIREADEKSIKENYAILRGHLQKNCTEPNVKAAMAYAAAERPYTEAHAASAEKSRLEKDGIALDSDKARERIGKAKLEAVKNAKDYALTSAVYTPYSEWEEEPEFKPTAKQFEELTIALEFPEPLTVVTQKGIREWISNTTAIDMDSESDNQAPLSDAQEMFCELLAECVTDLKKRESEAYAKFSRFCSQHSKAEGKVITEGDELNTGSPKQMQQLLYCKLGLPVRLTNIPDPGSFRDKVGVDGSPKTDNIAIQTAMAEDTEEGDWRRECLESLLKIREGKTRISLYHDPYPLWKHPTDNRIHPQIRDCGTVTRRPSGTSPNVLQVSKHQQDGVMRSIYVPYDEDELIVSVDFSQQELRIMASESRDANLISCYVGDNKRDVHSMTAAGIAKISYSEYVEAYADKTHEKHKAMAAIRKRPAKATNFLFAYLGEAGTLSQRLIIPYDEAEAMLQAAYDTYPDVQPWQDTVIKFAKKHGYSQTAYGTRRHASQTLFSKNKSTRRRMERQLVNDVIQGCAADILKIVLRRCWETNLWEETGATLLGPIYDEITSSVKIIHIPEYIERLTRIMEITPPGHVVPMEADVSLGHNWQAQIELGARPTKQAILEAMDKAVEAKREQQD
jgi:DNA polymerase I-like protein with 3'-5' exonuclease and polymerase domains/5'-3' exonuclease